MRLITDSQLKQVIEALKWANTISTKAALATLQALPEVEVVAKIDQLQNARMFTLTEGAGYDRFAPLYATKEPK